MDELKQQLANVEQQITEEKAKGAGRDTELISTLENKQAEILLKMDEEAKRAAQELIIEEHVSQEISFNIDGVDLTDLPVQVINLVSLIVRSERKQSAKAHLDALDAKDSEHQVEKAAMLETIATQAKAYESLEEDYGKCSAELQAQTVETLRLLDENKEIRQNRKNAADQLEEANKEIEQLKGQISDYQKAKVYGEVEAQKIIDITPESSEASDISAAVAALKTYISVENWGSINKVVKEDGSFELVKNAELEQGWAPAGATTFPEAPTVDTQDGGIPATESAIEPPALPSESTVPAEELNTVPADSTDGEVVSKTLEERVKALEAVVFAKTETVAA